MLRVDEGIEIVDKNGNPRIRLVIEDFGPQIEIFDDRGCGRLYIRIEDDCGKIGILSENGELAVGMGEGCDGGGVNIAAKNDPYSRADLLPVNGEYRLIISRKNNRQFHSDGSVSVPTVSFPDKTHNND